MNGQRQRDLIYSQTPQRDARYAVNISPMLMLILHWSWLRVVWLFLESWGGLWCCPLGGWEGHVVNVKSIISCVSEAASVLIFAPVSGYRSQHVLLHRPREDDHDFHHHYNIEQVPLKLTLAKNYYEVLVFPNYYTQDTHCGTMNLPSLTV